MATEISKILAITFGIFVAIATIELIYFLYPNLSPNVFKYSMIRAYDPYIGFVAKPHTSLDIITTSDVNFKVETKVIFDDVAFRDDGLESDRPFAIAVGDSFTFGWGVKLSDSWPEQLEKLLNNDVVNMGMPGYSTIQEYRIIEKHGVNLRPKVVLVGFFINDFVDNYDFMSNINQQSYPLKRILEENSIIYKAVRAAYYNINQKEPDPYIVYNDYLPTFSIGYPQSLNNESLVQIIEGKKLAEQSLLDLKKLLDTNDIQLVLVLIPIKEQIYWDMILENNPEYGNVDINYVTNSVKEFAEENDIMYIDMRGELFGRRMENIYFPYDGHLTPLGNSIVSGAVYKYLVDKNMLN